MAFETLGDRVWYAWQCLPRDNRGELPSWLSLELDHDLTNGTFHKLVHGLTKQPTYEKMMQVAEALQTTAEWLMFERGAPPTSSGWPVMPRPEPPPGAKKRQKTKSGETPSVKIRLR